MFRDTLRKIFKPISLPGWFVVLGGLIYALDAIDIVLSAWERVEKIVPERVMSVLEISAPYLAMTAGFLWVAWCASKQNPIEGAIGRLSEVKRQLRAYAVHAKSQSEEINSIKKGLLERAKREFPKESDKRSEIIFSYCPDPPTEWHAEVTAYLSKNLGPVPESHFQERYQDIFQARNVDQTQERIKDYYRDKNRYLLDLSQRIDITDLY